MIRDAVYVILVLVVVGGFYMAMSIWSPLGNPKVLENNSAVTPVNQNTGSTTVASTISQQSPSAFEARLSQHLFIVGQDGEVHGFNETKMAGVKYWALYRSASWCPACRTVTPRLVQFYNEFKRSHPDFELVFVSDDRADGDMISYMKEASMPWPAIWFSESNSPALDVQKYFGPFIPSLVLLDADGKVLSSSYQNGQYLGPVHVAQDITQMVQ